MKRLLSLITVTLIFVIALTSCSVIHSVIGLHTVTFDLNGGVGGEDFSESVNVFDGKTVKLPTPTKEEYTFDGWFTEDGTLFTADSPVTGSLTLTAKWHPKKVTVSFIDYYGNLITKETIDYGTGATAPSVDAIIENQKFVEWDKDFSCVTEDITVNVVYADNVYTISYNCGEITGSFTETCFVGELPAFPTVPEVEGYVFFGWYLDEELTERYFFDYTLDRDITLNAKFYDTSLGEYTVVSNVDQLMAISEQPDAKYLLACDINCKGRILTPIETFSGEFEGNGYKIFNFAINTTSGSAGFIYNNEGTIKNLSFDDYTYDVVFSGGGNTNYKINYAMVTSLNNGVIENCNVLDGTMHINYKVYKVYLTCYAGVFAGRNNGIITDCKSYAVLKTEGISDGAGDSRYDGVLTAYVGGIAGYNNNDINAMISGCVNIGEVDFSAVATAHGRCYMYVGSIVALNEGNVVGFSNIANINLEENDELLFQLVVGTAFAQNTGKIDTCSSAGNLNIKSNIDKYYNVGGFIGKNTGDIDNSYAVGDIVIDNSVAAIESVVGGFVAYNSGKIYNCYTATDITDNNNGAYLAVGGFAGIHELVNGYVGLINKCFTVSNISLGAVPTDSGYFVGKSTGTVKDCFYIDTMTLTAVINTEVTEGETTETIETVENIEPTCIVGEAKNYEKITSIDFIENTLYFDRMIWFVTEGKLPTLR